MSVVTGVGDVWSIPTHAVPQVRCLIDFFTRGGLEVSLDTVAQNASPRYDARLLVHGSRDVVAQVKYVFDAVRGNPTELFYPSTDTSAVNRLLFPDRSCVVWDAGLGHREGAYFVNCQYEIIAGSVRIGVELCAD